MSCSLVSPPTSASTPTRKRTMSFSAPSPNKLARTPLRRTGSYLSLQDMDAAVETPLYGRNGPQRYSSPPCASSTDCSHVVPYTRTLRHYKEQREKRKNMLHRAAVLMSKPSSTSSAVSITPSGVTMPAARTNSPLSPIQCVRPARASFPRSKPEPDLYRMAITTRMRMSPEGQKILHMGPRLAFSIHTATRELESLVATEREDWEMIDECT
ncbi:hypothetical protein SCP_1300400 [Sparassis crispa]|uniref:Uncharacterized protein n=1 Tax=Sparassis crispa TaxID=139825 RepID=A0A401H1B3_9APHY|nr:hypothetical protein SCP_1300400 [Sparassis crispa]GBE88226.1 hypothetical protein SCP_1300400 [Sparassis crispa]